MSPTQHTPLPWHKDIHGHIGDSKGTNIASTWTTPDENYPNGRPWQANAAFICKAVNNHESLMEALKEAEKALAHCYDVTEWPANGKSRQDKALAIVRQARAKAEGGAA